MPALPAVRNMPGVSSAKADCCPHTGNKTRNVPEDAKYDKQPYVDYRGRVYPGKTPFPPAPAP